MSFQEHSSNKKKKKKTSKITEGNIKFFFVFFDESITEDQDEEKKACKVRWNVKVLRVYFHQARTRLPWNFDGVCVKSQPKETRESNQRGESKQFLFLSHSN